MNDNHCPSYRLDSHRPHINAQQADIVKLQERLKVLEAEVELVNAVFDRIGIARTVGCATGRKDLTMDDRVEQLVSMWFFEREWRIK